MIEPATTLMPSRSLAGCGKSPLRGVFGGSASKPPGSRPARIFRGPLGAALLSLLILPAPAEAADIWSRMAEGGSISVAEIRSHGAQAFRALDADGNDVVTQEEFTQQPLPSRLGGYANTPELRMDLFDRMDLNSNGRITVTEWHDAIREDVSLADSNDDGTVTLRELSQADLGTVIMDFFD